MNKVLIITYYWPPSGGSGVQRWLKFVKYLPSYQWEPHVFTPENPSFAVQDKSLEKDVPNEAEVMRMPIWEPYDLFFRISGFFGSKKSATPTALVPSRKKTFFQRISTWIRGNLFIPDPRIFWVKPSARFLADYIRDNGIRIIITTGPPHSIHLIGLRLKEKHPHLKWVADFRDPWTEWGMWDSLMVSKPVRRIHKRMESKVLAHADEIITITPFYVRRFEKLSGRRVRLLTNGFDEDDFKDLIHRKDEKFIIRHIGLINEKCDPRSFINALRTEMKADTAFAGDVRLEFIGEVHPDFREFVVSDKDTAKVTLFTGNISHEKLISLYGSSALLLFVLSGYKDAEGFLPGKLFEYLAADRPIMGVGPVAGDAADLLRETGSGAMVETGDEAGMRKFLRDHYLSWKAGISVKGTPAKGAMRYSRKQVTGELVKILQDQLD